MGKQALAELAVRVAEEARMRLAAFEREMMRAVGGGKGLITEPPPPSQQVQGAMIKHEC